MLINLIDSTLPTMTTPAELPLRTMTDEEMLSMHLDSDSDRESADSKTHDSPESTNEREKAAKAKSLLSESIPWERSLIRYIERSETQPQMHRTRLADRIYLSHSDMEDKAYTFDGDDISIFSEASTSARFRRSQFIHRSSVSNRGTKAALADEMTSPEATTRKVSFNLISPDSPNTVVDVTEVVYGEVEGREDELPLERSTAVSEIAIPDTLSYQPSDDHLYPTAGPACMCLGYDIMGVFFPPKGRNGRASSFRNRPMKPINEIFEEARQEAVGL